MRALLELTARNFRSLKRVSVELGSLNVLVGPNQAGKSNFLDTIEFLGDAARLDLPYALESRGGLDRVRFRGESDSGLVSLEILANVTSNSSLRAPDDYALSFYSRRMRTRTSERSVLIRNEELTFKRTRGRGRRLTVSGDKAEFLTVTNDHQELTDLRVPLRSDSLALSTLRRLPKEQGGDEIERLAQLFTTFRVFNVDIVEAKKPSRLSREPLQANAGNLASVLLALREDAERFRDLLDDARAMIPGFETLEFEAVGGGSPALAIRLVETGLRDATYLDDASFGAVRILALLALLYDPEPPLLTCIEEVDHGLHPHVFDRLVERLREASERTQLLIATHSPALVNRLRADELLVCERSADGSTLLPAASSREIRRKEAAAGDRLRLGEIWFSGSLGGVPR